MAPFVAVFVVAAVTTAAVTPGVGRLARRVGAVDEPGDPRKVHRLPVPTMGGLGMLVGFLAALGVARVFAALGWDRAGDGTAAFAPVFAATSEPLGLVLGAVLITATGVVDDLRGLSPPVKLAGQILGAVPVVLLGIQVVYAWIPGVGVVVLSPDLGVPLTVFGIVAMVNAVNVVDGLDGLAAGVAAIAAIAFFVFAHGSEGIAEAAPTSATLVAAATAGIALGFLVHNFHPARIFMGDTGAMLLGLLLAAGGIAFVGRTTDPGYVDFAGVFPLAIPAVVVAFAFLDTAFAIARRVYRGRPISVADRGHIHHRLLRAGIGHRRVVLTVYFWSAVVAFSAVAMTYLPPVVVLGTAGGLVSLGATATRRGLRRDGLTPPAGPVVGGVAGRRGRRRL